MPNHVRSGEELTHSLGSQEIWSVLPYVFLPARRWTIISQIPDSELRQQTLSVMMAVMMADASFNSSRRYHLPLLTRQELVLRQRHQHSSTVRTDAGLGCAVLVKGNAYNFETDGPGTGDHFYLGKYCAIQPHVPVEWVHGYSTQVLQNFSIDQEASTVLTPGRVNTFTAACHKLAGMDAYLHCSTIEPDVPTTPPESEALTCSFIELWILTTDQHLREGPVGSDAVEAVLIGK